MSFTVNQGVTEKGGYSTKDVVLDGSSQWTGTGTILFYTLTAESAMIEYSLKVKTIENSVEKTLTMGAIFTLNKCP